MPAYDLLHGLFLSMTVLCVKYGKSAGHPSTAAYKLNLFQTRT